MEEQKSVEIPKTNLPSLVGQNVFLNDEAFRFAQRIATLLAQSKLVPAHYQNNVPDCLIAFQRSLKLDVDPFVFMSHTSVVRGRLCYEGKFVAALLNERGPYSHDIRYDYSGEGDSRACRAWGTRRDGTVDELVLTVKTAKQMGWWERNPIWQSLTDQMLAYRSAKMLGDKYCPQLTLGLLTREEVIDVEGVEVVRARKISVLNDIAKRDANE